MAAVTRGESHRRLIEMPVDRWWTQAWLGVVGVGFINGGLHKAYEPALGDLRSHQLSVVLYVALFVPYVRWAQHRHPLPTTAGAVRVGMAWAAATVMFEFVFGHFVNGDTWHSLLDAYNFMHGRLWSIDVAAIAAGPSIARRFTRAEVLT